MPRTRREFWEPKLLGNKKRDGINRHKLKVLGWDVLVHSTHSEGLSMALLEGMMAARPIVASDVTGVRDVIAHRLTGLLVGENDDAAMADAIEELLRDRALAARLGAAARQHALDDFSMRRMAAEYERLVDEM